MALTIDVLAIVVGLSEVAVAVNIELNNISNAIGALDQNYWYVGFRVASTTDVKANVEISGSRWDDATDDCDKNLSCDLVSGICDIVTGNE